MPPLFVGENGKLNYTPDSLGNRIPDFSYAGYMAGEQPIPNAPIKVVVPVSKGDATLRIQSAIDYVSSLPLDKAGIRGVVLLEKGVYHVDGGLKITSSGVIIRGSGMGTDGTILRGEGLDRQTLIRIYGKNDHVIGEEIKITDVYVPVNASTIHVASPQLFKVGDQVILHRPSTQKWIETLGTETFGGGISALGWKPGQRDINWYRKIVAVNGETISLDAPITSALDSTYGGGTIASYKWPGRISQVGIENLSCQSAYDINNPKDEAHRWMAITMENINDAWVRQVVFEHFAGSAVELLETSQRVTVEDCKSLMPVSEIGGQRRYTFFTSGQQTLFQRDYAENGYHDFSVGFCAAGPNAFVQCHSQLPYSFSGAIDSWASGTLFDIVNVDGNALKFSNLGQDAQGAGWTAANSVFYQCTAAKVACYKPPTANNWAFGTWAQFLGDGYWGESNNAIQPRSLYYAQLSARLGDNVLKRAQILPLNTSASSSPSVKVAAELTAQSVIPVLTLFNWIGQAPERNPIPLNKEGAKTIDQIGFKPLPVPALAAPLHVQNGWLVRGNKILTGKRPEVPWWTGTSRTYGLKEAKFHITRFVPGRTGTGLTDDLDEMTDQMVHNNIIGLEHNYGLWYDRRRDDHERIRRMDGEVWPPFYELPFARSGQGLAWDGLSKYDLTKYNTWYWGRLKKFGDLADQKGLVLIHQDYFQHNIIEAGAHYVDFPWRTANNINNTGFPEPPPFAGDKRIFLGEQFYDITNPVRRQLHKAYIRKCLDNFADNNGVIHFTAAEFTGPLHFVRFWLNTISDWEKEKGKKALIGLSTTKDVQDSILADPALSSVIDVIDIRYWHYEADGKAYVPLGGENLAPRQHARLLNPKKSSFQQVYRAVREYRDKYPKKAVIYSGDSFDAFGWAAFMAGGSLANLPPVIIYPGFFISASGMLPLNSSNQDGQFLLSNQQNEYIIYFQKPGTIKVDLNKAPGSFIVRWIDSATGAILQKEEKISGGKFIELEAPKQGSVAWVTRK